MMMIRCALLILLSTLSLKGYADNHASLTDLPERVIWDDRAIPLHIPTGHERTVHFPEAVRYWMPDHLALKLTALSANGVLYLQAHQPFETTRIRVQAIESQQLYLLDVQSHQQAGTLAKLIILNPTDSAKSNVETQPKRTTQDWYERLHRYAAQQLYAPERLIKNDAAIRRLRMTTEPLTGLLRDSRITTSTLATWRGGDYFITAIRLYNQSRESLALVFPNQASFNSATLNPGIPKNAALTTIDIPTTLRGGWLTASVQHHMLAPVDDQDATTTLYLVSTRPFFEAWGYHNGE